MADIQTFSVISYKYKYVFCLNGEHFFVLVSICGRGFPADTFIFHFRLVNGIFPYFLLS